MDLRFVRPTAFAVGLLFSISASADTSLEPRTAQIMPKAAEAILNDVTPVGDAWVTVGDRGHILRSSDGDQWQQVVTPVQAMLNRVRFYDDRLGWAVGHDGTVLKTSDAGKTWSLIHSDPEWGKPFYDILFITPEVGFVVGANSVFKRTDDGGKSWELLEPDFTFHGLHLNSIWKLADGTMVIGGEKGMMARSLDQGVTWEHVKTPYAGSFFGMMPYADSGVFVYGLRGNVYAAYDIKSLDVQDTMEWDEFSLESLTDNAQLHEMGWHYYPNDLKESLFGGVVLGSTDVLLVGVNGAVVRTDGQRMKTLDTRLEHTLGSAVITDEALVTVGLVGIQSVPFSR